MINNFLFWCMNIIKYYLKSSTTQHNTQNFKLYLLIKKNKGMCGFVHL